jgi:uncharacterized protein (DUF2384 family)
MTPRQQRSNLARAARSDIRRREKLVRALENLSPETVSALYSELRQIFTDDSAVAEWLLTPAPFLAGRIPVLAARTNAGREEVIQTIRGIAHGNVL